jgi:hypothetical protein
MSVPEGSDYDTDCPASDDVVSEWSDEDDDGTNWWSGMNRHGRGFKATSIRVAISSIKEDTFCPSGRGMKDYEGVQVMKTAAAMMLMTLLYPARLARFDILKAFGFLAKCITRWDAKCDARLHHLMCYINTTLRERMIGFIGDDPISLTLHLY